MTHGRWRHPLGRWHRLFIWWHLSNQTSGQDCSTQVAIVPGRAPSKGQFLMQRLPPQPSLGLPSRPSGLGTQAAASPGAVRSGWTDLVAFMTLSRGPRWCPALLLGFLIMALVLNGGAALFLWECLALLGATCGHYSWEGGGWRQGARCLWTPHSAQAVPAPAPPANNWPNTAVVARLRNSGS